MGWPKEYGGQGRAADGAGDRGRRDGAGGRARPDERARPRHRRAPPSWCTAPTRRSGATSARSSPPRRCGASSTPSPTRAPTWPRSRTAAVDRGDHFEVNGQKIWTSGGAIADWGLLLARTDPAVPKHKGITCFLMDMRQPGVDVRPLKQITGSSEFCEVFMTGARVEKENTIGRLGEGWGIAQTTLGYERGGRALARVTTYASQYRQLVDAARRLKRNGRPIVDDPVTRQKLGRVWADLEVERYGALRTLTMLERGEHPGAGGSITKLSYSEFEKRFMELAEEILGPYGQLTDGRAAGVSPGSRHRDRRSRHLGLRVPVVARGHHLRRLLRDPEERHRRAHPGAAEGSPGRPCRRHSMNFSFSEDQVLLRSSVRAALDEQCTPARVRAMMDDGVSGYDEALWGEMAKLGWLGLPFPEEQGGAGLGLVELALVLEEMGRAAYPGPYFASVVLGGLGLMLGGSAGPEGEVAARDRLGPGARERGAAGGRGSTGIPPPPPRPPRAPATAGALTGIKRFVPWAHVADVVLVPGARARGPLASSWWTRAAAGRDARAHGRHRPRQPLVGAAPDRGAGARRRAGGPGRQRGPGAGGAPAPRRGGRLRRDARRGAPLPRHERGLRQGARAVRPAHRLVPGHPPPLRGDAGRGRELALRGLLRGVGARRRGGGRGRAPPPSASPTSASRPARSAATRSRSTAASASPGSTTSTSTSSAPRRSSRSTATPTTTAS